MASIKSVLQRTDWRILFGISVTLCWVAAGLVYLIGGSVRGNLFEIPLENLGSFLEGAFAPLAFLWLVIGLFIQQKELADNTEVLRETSIQSAKQTQAIAATELNARQESFFKIAESVRRQLGSISGMLFISSQLEDSGGQTSVERSKELWHMLSTGDLEVFAREFLMIENNVAGSYETLFYGTTVRERHSRNFAGTFERLLKLAENCDVDGIIVDSIAQTGHGMLYNLMLRHDPHTELSEADAQAPITNTPGRPKLVDASAYQDIVDHSVG